VLLPSTLRNSPAVVPTAAAAMAELGAKVAGGLPDVHFCPSHTPHVPPQSLRSVAIWQGRPHFLCRLWHRRLQWDVVVVSAAVVDATVVVFSAAVVDATVVVCTIVSVVVVNAVVVVGA